MAFNSDITNEIINISNRIHQEKFSKEPSKIIIQKLQQTRDDLFEKLKTVEHNVQGNS